MTSKKRLRHRPARVWEPYDASRSQLKAWWSAKDIGTSRVTDETGRVISFIDRISSIDCTAGTGTTARPTAGNASFIGANGATYKGITFDGIANVLTGGVTGLPLTSTPSIVVVLATGPVTAADGSNRNVFTYGGTATGQYKRVRKTTIGSATTSDGLIAATVNSGAGLWGSSPKIVTGMFDATTVSARGNGYPANTTSGATLNTGNTRTRIGADSLNTATSFWDGVIAEILVFTLGNTSLYEQIEGYLAWQYGCTSLLPSTHRFKNAAPTS